MLLRVEDLSIKMTHGQSLHDISFALREGECIVIKTEILQVGTILLRSLLALEDGVSGKIFIDGTDILRTNSRRERLKLRKSIGLVYRERGLISVFNVADNIALPLGYHHDVSKKELEDAVISITEKLDIQDLLPLHVQDLNGTETRLVALARELIRKPQILLIDAVLEGLTDNHRKRVIAAIEALRKNTDTAVIMTSRSQHLPEETRAYELRNGNFSAIAT